MSLDHNILILSARPIWPGSTEPTDENLINPSSELETTENGDTLAGFDYTEQTDNIVDISTRRRYVTEEIPSSSSNISYMNTNINGEYVNISSERRPRTVSVDAVIRGGSAIVSAISVMSLLGTWLSGVLIIQPIFAILLLLLSLGFYLMTLAKE
jgi:hypothetical protein